MANKIETQNEVEAAISLINLFTTTEGHVKFARGIDMMDGWYITTWSGNQFDPELIYYGRTFEEAVDAVGENLVWDKVEWP